MRLPGAKTEPKSKEAGKHADTVTRRFIQGELSANDRRVGREATLPQVVAQHHAWRAVPLAFFRAEQPAE